MPKLPTAAPVSVLLCLFAVLILRIAFAHGLSAERNSAVVRAVLFASPTCPHCAKVREEVLPPLVARYGPQLQIAIVSTASQPGHELFLTACMKYGLLRLSVPLLIVGNAAMVGADEIPQRFPALIEKHIAAGGVDWPKIAGLGTMLAANPAFAAEMQPHGEPLAAKPGLPEADSIAGDVKPAAEAAPVPMETAIEEKTPEPPKTASVPASQPLRKLKSDTSHHTGESSVEKSSPVRPPPSVTPHVSSSSGSAPASQAVPPQPSGIIDLTGEKESVIERIKRDIYGNGLSILILAGMVVTILMSPLIIRKLPTPAVPDMKPRYDWVIPILVLAGLGVAAYLSNIEVRRVEAVCGPVGDCNTVNQSEYARLLGILPVGVLGLVGFLGILAAWILRRWGSDKISLWAAVGILGMTGFGTLFSIYLTFLEPFVIGATCLWCLSSAVIMTTLFILAMKPGRQAWSVLV